MIHNICETTAADHLDSLAEDALELCQIYKEDVARALDLICLDSRKFPERYLEDTLVPYGGE